MAVRSFRTCARRPSMALPHWLLTNHDRPCLVSADTAWLRLSSSRLLMYGTRVYVTDYADGVWAGRSVTWAGDGEEVDGTRNGQPTATQRPKTEGTET